MTHSDAPPRLLIVCQGIDGGVAPLSSALAYGLREKGWDCSLLYIGRPATPVFVQKDRQRGIDSHAIVTGKARSWAEVWGLIRSVSAVWRVVRDKRPASIIFAGFMPAFLYAPFLRLATSAQFVLWDHAPQNTFLKIKKLVFPVALKGLDRIVSIAPGTAAAMTEYFGVPADEVTIIPNGVDPTRWQAIPPARDLSALRVIMPARADLNQKDPITLICAAARLRKQGVDIEVTLVGSGVDEARVREAIEAEGAAAFIHSVATSNDVPSLVAKHNVVCLSTKFEGLPTVVIEGMLARRIVLASRVAGCVDVIRDGENGFLFTAGSAEDCAEKLRALTSMPAPQTIIENAYQDAMTLYAPVAMVENFHRVLAG